MFIYMSNPINRWSLKKSHGKNNLFFLNKVYWKS